MILFVFLCCCLLILQNTAVCENATIINPIGMDRNSNTLSKSIKVKSTMNEIHQSTNPHPQRFMLSNSRLNTQLESMFLTVETNGGDVLIPDQNKPKDA
jgi:hypothetical protein